MTNRKTTRRALFMSIISLILCCAMLVGTTMAWFTDSVTSGRNTITAGNLDVELQYKRDLNDEWTTVTSDTELFEDETLWEPGYTQVVYLNIINKGTLALKYQIGLNVVTETPAYNVEGKQFQLSNYIQFGTTDTQPTSREAAREAVKANATSIFAGYEHPRYNSGSLEAGQETPLTLVAYMPETVGNEANYRGTAPSIQLGLNLVAAQKTYESDSFDELYDQNATFPQGGYGSSDAPDSESGPAVITARDPATNAKVATATVFAESVADPDLPVELIVERIEQDDRIDVSEDQAAVTYDVTVTNLKEGNTEPVKVELRVGTGLTGIRLFHNETEITDFTYNSETGYVIFESTSFSPFTVIYDQAASQEPVTPSEMPKAIVANADQYEGVDLDWESYGSWQPSSPTQQLESAYSFTAPHNSETVKDCSYKDWYCDYYVSIDTDLNADDIFLGGNYGSFGWIGFENPIAVSANEEIALLGSVTTNPWTYEMIASNVGTFICGVAQADNGTQDLTGKTFTVKLRLTNPENEDEYYDVNTVSYTFKEAGSKLPYGMPEATVDDADEFENAELDWGSYGTWSPADAAQQLESAYSFTAPHDSETVKDCSYKDWHCDYYVSIDTDLSVGDIFLGGNYGSFGWIGFENPIAVSANEEIALLGSVTSNPWTYEQIVNSVGEFICGVAQSNGNTTNDLTGKTFTVKLRLTNPDDSTEYYDVNTVNYTFQ